MGITPELRIRPEYWAQAKNELSEADFIMAQIIASYEGENLESRGDAFFSLSRSIVGQQVSVKAADSIWNKLENLAGEITPRKFLLLGEKEFRAAGLSRQKITYIKNLAEVISNNTLRIKDFHKMDDIEVIAELRKIKGIGNWTAEMFLIFHLMRPNVFPVNDIGLRKAIIKHYSNNGKLSDKLLNNLSRRWRPWRSVATWYLWRSLDPVPVKY